MKNNLAINQENRNLLQESIKANGVALYDNEKCKKEIQLTSNTPLGAYMNSDEYLNITLAATTKMVEQTSDTTTLLIKQSEFQYNHIMQQILSYLINDNKDLDIEVLSKYSQYCDLHLSFELEDVVKLFDQISTINNLKNVNVVKVARYVYKELIQKFKNVKYLIDFKLAQL